MTDQASPTNPGAIDAAPALTGDGGLDARIAAVNAMLDEGSPATAGEPTVSDGAPPTPAASTSQGGSPAASDDPAKRAEERRARLEEAKLRMRQRVDDKARQTAHERMQADLAAAQKRIADAEAAAQARLDRVTLKDPIAILREMEREGVPADAVANAIRERMQNPEAVAERMARTAITPEVAAIRKENEALKARLDAFEKAQAEAQAQAEEERSTQEFLGFVKQSAQAAPLSAKLLDKNPREFIQLATLAAERVQGLGPTALLDAVEEMIHTEVRTIAETYSSVIGLIPSQQTQALPPTPRAAAQANTVSNSLAQGRTAIVDEEKDWAALPLEERAARLIRSA